MPDNKLIHIENWGKLTQAFDTKEIPAPFVKEIFLLDSQIVGTGYVDDIEQKTERLVPGDVLELRREPGNAFDEHAIMILNAEGEKIGYVPHKDNLIFARLMDAGKMLFGKVKEMANHGGWLKISIEIYMRDI